MTITMVLDHLLIVAAAVVLTVAVGVPTGVCSYYFPRVGKVILKLAEVLQTVPTLALLGILMVFLGAGKLTVIIGLFLYSLLPVVLNTHVGLSEIDPSLKEMALGMGMTKINRLFRVELPLAFPLIFTGIRIATVTSIGVAVFAASVGGGGLGSIINRSIRISDMQMLMKGTLALMIMAIVFDFVMGLVEKRLNLRLLGRSK